MDYGSRLDNFNKNSLYVTKRIKKDVKSKQKGKQKKSIQALKEKQTNFGRIKINVKKKRRNYHLISRLFLPCEFGGYGRANIKFEQHPRELIEL